MWKIVLFLAILTYLFSACSDAKSSDIWQNKKTEAVKVPEDWKPTSIPKSNKEIQEANMSNDIIISISADNSLELTSKKPVLENELTVDNGKIIGYDGGEWGGCVKFISTQGLEYTLSAENFRGFLRIKNQVYFMTGLSHLTFDSGNIYEVMFEQNFCKAVKKIELASCPKVFINHDNEAIVVTNKSIFSYDGEEMKTIYQDAFWSRLYPNSLINVENLLYIGMRGGVFEYNRETKIGIWYNFSN